MITRKYHPLFEDTAEVNNQLPQIQQVIEQPKTAAEIKKYAESLLQHIKDSTPVPNLTKVDNTDSQKLTKNAEFIKSTIQRLEAILSRVQLNSAPLSAREIRGLASQLRQINNSLTHPNAQVTHTTRIIEDNATQVVNTVNIGIVTALQDRINPAQPENGQNNNVDLRAILANALKNAQNVANDLGETIQTGVESIFTPAQTETSSTEPEALGTQPTATPAEMKETANGTVVLPSEIFTRIIRPAPRPENEEPLEKDQLTVELNKLYEANDVDTLTLIASQIEEKSLRGVYQPLSMKSEEQLTASIRDLALELVNANDKSALFNAILKTLTVGDSYVIRAKAYLAKAETKTEQKAETQVKEFDAMTEGERQNMINALFHNELFKLSKDTPSIISKPEALTVANITSGKDVGELYKIDGDLRSRFYPGETRGLNPKSITINPDGKSFTYKENGQQFKVDRIDTTGTQTRTIPLSKDLTTFLSSMIRSKTPESKDAASQIQQGLRNRLDNERTFFSIQSYGDKGGQMIIKTLPSKK